MWYSANFLFESRINGELIPEPLCEESIVVVEADNEETARADAFQIGKNMEHSYQNEQGETVSWHFVNLVELQDLSEKAIKSGIEVYSRMFRARRDTDRLSSLSVFNKTDLTPR